MPIYEFKCGHCGHAFDEMVDVGKRDETYPPCPKCLSRDTKRQIASGVSVVMKDENWGRKKVGLSDERL